MTLKVYKKHEVNGHRVAKSITRVHLIKVREDGGGC